MDQNEADGWPNIIEVAVNNRNFRVNPRTFITQRTGLKFINIVWLEIVIACIVLMLIDTSSSDALTPNKKYLPLLIEVIIYLCFLSLAVCLNSSSLSPIFTCSTLLSTAYFLSATILYSREAEAGWIASIVFVLAQTLLCFLFMKNYKIIIVFIALGIQLILISCKFDGKLQNASWSQLLIILIIMFLITFVVSLALIVIGLIEHFKEHSERLFQPIGIIYIGMTLFALSLSASVIITDLMMSFPVYSVGILCLLFHIALIIFNKKNSYEISLYKSHALPSNILQSLQSNKYPRVIKQTVLYKISSHFYSLKPPKDMVIRQTQLVLYPLQSKIQCLVCLSEQAVLVWMPCGHMCVCQVCGRYLMDRRKLKCVMCKRKGEAIYHVSKQQLKLEKDEYSTDFFYKIKNL